MTEPNCTAVIIAYRKNRLNTRLIFGQPRAEIRRGWHRKLALFYLGDVFAFERWRGDRYGTQDWRLAVCRAASGGSITAFPGIIPGAELWLNISGKTRVKRALACIDGLKAKDNPLEKMPESIWRELHHRLLCGETEDQITADIGAGLPC